LTLISPLNLIINPLRIPSSKRLIAPLDYIMMT